MDNQAENFKQELDSLKLDSHQWAVIADACSVVTLKADLGPDVWALISDTCAQFLSDSARSPAPLHGIHKKPPTPTFVYADAPTTPTKPRRVLPKTPHASPKKNTSPLQSQHYRHYVHDASSSDPFARPVTPVNRSTARVVTPIRQRPERSDDLASPDSSADAHSSPGKARQESVLPSARFKPYTSPLRVSKPFRSTGSTMPPFQLADDTFQPKPYNASFFTRADDTGTRPED